MRILPPDKISAYLAAAEGHGVLPMFYLELTVGFTLDTYTRTTSAMQKAAADKVGSFIARAV